MPKLPGSVGKYKITDRLGRGGMSILYKAEHPSLGTPVVLKKLTLKGNPAHRERFRREATLMMKLRHKNVVGVYDHFKEGAAYYLVMEFVDGRPLSELLAREGALPPKEAAWLAGQIATALAHIHSQGIVHRDMKPSNILLSRDGTVKLGDFGIAFTPGGDEDITVEGTALGTPTFMAPEQLEDARRADERSDMWSFGVCLFELITGRKFITGPSPAAIREALPDAVRTWPHRIPPKLPADLRRILRKTLRMKPESRLRNGQAAVRILRAPLRSDKAPEGLQNRLDALVASMEHVSEPTPKAAEIQPPEKASPARGRLDLHSLFAGPGDSAQDNSDKDQDKKSKPERKRSAIIARLGRRPAAAVSAGVGLFCLVLLLIVPGAWDRVFRRGSQGPLSLQLVYPDGAPDFWLTGAEARLYREDIESLNEVASPVLRPHGNEQTLISRRISLPAGAYRLRWSLGDRVSWQSFRLPSFRENRRIGSAPPVLVETLGDPPSFPLDLNWSAFDALDGRDISDRTLMAWENVDNPDAELVSGGRYQFVYKADGYRSAYFAVAVSPWRRSLSLQAGLWPNSSTLTIQNETGRSLMPRINGSSRYLDMEESPEMKRIGRLKSDSVVRFEISPGSYTIAPGMGKSAELGLFISSGDELTVIVESDDESQMTLRLAD